ncbi:MAG TPA: sigma 54-interacting transcriptional regulator [Haliangiales bacterium]|nr:sigma 54-interacting transcriptional regulator [Haliangiales bacterium]
MTRGDLDEPTGAEATAESGPAGTPVRGFRLTLVEGAGLRRPWTSTGARSSLGSHPSNDLVLRDPTVSRFHCELVAGPDGVRVRDLDSRNGTFVEGVRVRDALVEPGRLLRLGRLALRLEVAAKPSSVKVSDKTRFGALVGASPAMRAVFAVLERAADSEATVLLEGETGTGKGAAAEALHSASARRDRPFLVVDCGAVPGTLLDSELFGHEKGAFTGADTRRIGAFEEASGGTIFLDEIGELPGDMQPKLLRALENREIRRLGQNVFRPVDVRVIAATNRDLRGAVNEGKFRADLYYRLAVVRVTLPPLRDHLADIPLVVEQLLSGLAPAPAQQAPLLDAAFLASLQAHPWPGNIRELRNYLERCLILDAAPPVGEGSGPGDAEPDDTLTFPEARRRALDAFERRYLEALLRRHDGKVAAAARAAGIARVYFYRLLAKHGIKP